MNHEQRITVLFMLSFAGCVLADAKLGDGAESTDDGQSHDSSDSGDMGASITATSESDSATGPAEPVPNSIGEPCDHGWEPGVVPQSKLLTFPALDCEGLVCVYADIGDAPQDACASDVECNASDPGVDRFVCNEAESTCELSPAYFAERSMCSAMCEVDADCATDAITTCQTGFACVPLSSLGDACCEPVCVCRDDLDDSSTQDLIQKCEAGTQEGCCDVTPGNGLCPD